MSEGVPLPWLAQRRAHASLPWVLLCASLAACAGGAGPRGAAAAGAAQPALVETSLPLGGLDRRAVYQDAVPLDAEPRVRWRFETGERSFASAAVADGVAVVGTQGGTMVAVDAASGQELWRRRAADSVMKTAVIHRGMVNLGPAYSRGRDLYALELRSGRILWQRPLGPVVVSALPVDDVLLVYHREVLLAVERTSGAERWRRALFGMSDAVMAAGVTAELAYRDGRLYVATRAGGVSAIDLQTQQELWRAVVPFYVDGAVIVGDEHLWVPSSGQGLVDDRPVGPAVYRMALDSGAAERLPLPCRARYGALALEQATLIVACDEQAMLAFDTARSELLWQRALPAAPEGAVVLGGHTVVFGASDRRLRGLALQTGEPRWELELDGCANRPVAYRGALYLVTGGPGSLYRVDLVGPGSSSRPAPSPP